MSLVNDNIRTIYCKNHPETPSPYFVTDQPWIRYCKQCALNVALCGRNISQDFSNDEFERKMQIQSIVNELKRNTQLSEQNNSSYEKIINMLEEGMKPLNEQISGLGKSIQELTVIRDKLQNMLEKEMSGKVN